MKFIIIIVSNLKYAYRMIEDKLYLNINNKRIPQQRRRFSGLFTEVEKNMRTGLLGNVPNNCIIRLYRQDIADDPR